MLKWFKLRLPAPFELVHMVEFMSIYCARGIDANIAVDDGNDDEYVMKKKNGIESQRGDPKGNNIYT